MRYFVNINEYSSYYQNNQTSLPTIFIFVFVATYMCMMYVYMIAFYYLFISNNLYTKKCLYFVLFVKKQLILEKILNTKKSMHMFCSLIYFKFIKNNKIHNNTTKNQLIIKYFKVYIMNVYKPCCLQKQNCTETIIIIMRQRYNKIGNVCVDF